MNINRALKVRNEQVTRVKDLHSIVRATKMTFDDYLVRRSEIANTYPKGTPQWVRDYVTGYETALYDRLWELVEFCYQDAKGVLYSTWRDSTHRKTQEFYDAGKGADLGKLPRAHFWAGTSKPWTKLEADQPVDQPVS